MKKNINTKKIGLIVARGTIYDGNQPAGNIGGDSFSKLLRQAKGNKSISALVIRVDSGGGSAFASEVIRQQIQDLRTNGLPVYISMGSVAASGGYWIASGTDGIWATPTTITGSIGVFGLIPNIGKSLNKVGINVDGVATTKLASGVSIDRPLSDDAKTLIQGSVENIYQKFLTLVADARNTDTSAINDIAGGRVWVGETAKELNLVDNLGTLQDLFKHIAQSDSYTVEMVEPNLSPREQFIKKLTQGVSIIQHKLLANSMSQKIKRALPSSAFEQIIDYLNTANRQQEWHKVTPIAACLECEVL